MLDLNQVHADFAHYLAGNASHRHSPDAALMHVVEAAYQKGLTDALLVPAVLRDTIPDLDTGMAAGNGSAAGAELAAVAAAGVPETADGAGQSGSVEGGNDPAAPPDTKPELKGGALAKLAAMWCNQPRFQAWLKTIARDVWDRHASKARGAEVGEVEHLIAGNVLREMCGVVTRAELDHVPAACNTFNRLIRLPYAEFLRGKS